MMYKNVEFQLQASHKDGDWMDVFHLSTDKKSVSGFLDTFRTLLPEVSFRVIRSETITTVEELHIAGEESSAGLELDTFSLSAKDWLIAMHGMFDSAFTEEDTS